MGSRKKESREKALRKALKLVFFWKRSKQILNSSNMEESNLDRKWSLPPDRANREHTSDTMPSRKVEPENGRRESISSAKNESSQASGQILDPSGKGRLPSSTSSEIQISPGVKNGIRSPWATEKQDVDSNTGCMMETTESTTFTHELRDVAKGNYTPDKKPCHLPCPASEPSTNSQSQKLDRNGNDSRYYSTESSTVFISS